MKKLTRKLFISILAAVFAVVALGTSTFAWITISNTAVVKEFSGQVEAGTSGIELSADATSEKDGNWTTALDLTSLVAQQNIKFSDITTTDGKTFADWTLSTGQPVSKPVKSTDYITVSFLVRRSVNATKDVILYVDNSTVVFAHGDNDSATFPLDVKVPDYPAAPGSLFVDNAARMSIAVAAEEPVNDVVKGVYEQALDSNANTNGYSASGFAAKYMAAKQVIAPEYQAPGFTTIKNGTADTLEIARLTDANPFVKLTVRVWVEGFDNECHSRILNQTLKVNFGFTSKEVEPIK